jgi:hypothetical protein
MQRYAFYVNIFHMKKTTVALFLLSVLNFGAVTAQNDCLRDNHLHISCFRNQDSQQYEAVAITTADKNLLIDTELVRQHITGKGILISK